ncbi:MAG: phage portal protein [Gammaproteobacteria bacterium RIFCSPHIGHO2_12_FULL_63_22]|nr:MAG: phage portal protein [Gammaproteobacteria bacterium RIFCSPHIGHO2_12_FULL_63_22]
MIASLVDQLVGLFSPGRQLERLAARATLDQIAAVSNGKGGYAAGKYNRLTNSFERLLLPENQIPRAQLDQCEAESWNLYRNNPYARKIVRTIETKVIGRGMHPNSQAKGIDGKPHVEFRKAARKLWWALHNCCDVRGKPGRGGLDLVEQQKLALRTCILSGEALVRRKTLSRAKQQALGSPIRLALQMIAPRRLSQFTKADGFEAGHDFYRGIELNQDGERVAYHITSQRLDEFNLLAYDDVARVDADQIYHLYVQDDVDQLRGVPWLAPAILQTHSTGDYQYNVLKSAAIAACVALGYRLSRSKTQFGLNGTDNDAGELIDDDGNKITRMKAGMMINLGQDGDLKGFTPNQPTTNAEAFIQHMLRGVGTAMPGVKASTITGDYRNSSFSSERSADNDCWPEMEGVQDWFASGFLQPFYEEVIRLGVAAGYFAGIVTPEEFADREPEFLDTNWSGPVPRSINPKDDDEAASMRIAGGRSSPQIENAAIGRDSGDVQQDIIEWIAECKANGLPEWYIAASLGQKPAAPAQPQQGQANAEQANSTA